MSLSPFKADCLEIAPGVRHGFFTRQGGVSAGLYKSLNCGAGSKDDRVSVIENRARVAEHLQSPLGDVQTLYQVHSAKVLAVDRLSPREALAEADALVTATRGLAIGVLTADCAPVLFFDPEARVAGAAHAGWRGALTGVLEATIAAMEALGASRQRLCAAIGPCISQQSYEVGTEFEAEFTAVEPAYSRFFKVPRGARKPRFDLPGFVHHRLQAAGAAIIENSAPCTYVNESLFYSYRRSQHRHEPDYGRQISAILVA